jgi:hypothetical protein
VRTGTHFYERDDHVPFTSGHHRLHTCNSLLLRTAAKTIDCFYTSDRLEAERAANELGGKQTELGWLCPFCAGGYPPADEDVDGNSRKARSGNAGAK